MIQGNPIKIVIVDDSTRSELPAAVLSRRGYDVVLTPTDGAISAILMAWPDLIVLAQPGTSIEETCLDSEYLRHKKVIRCHE